MKCPVDDSELRITERNGIEIDYCPQCRGVWLDRGELDKIVERATAYEQRISQPSDKRYTERRDEDYDDNYDDDYDDDYPKRKRYPQRKRRKSFFDDIFDIFD